MGEEQINVETLASISSYESESDELQGLEQAPPFWRTTSNKKLSKQLSMRETNCDMIWERRRRQMLKQSKKNSATSNDNDQNLTDEDLNELKASIELGFGFNEEQGQKLCNTLPALDLYFAVNRRFSISPLSSPNGRGSTSSSSSSLTSNGDRPLTMGSPGSDSDSWKICSPGENPEQVKTRLRHWAQAVACSVMQSS